MNIVGQNSCRHANAGGFLLIHVSPENGNFECTVNKVIDNSYK